MTQGPQVRWHNTAGQVTADATISLSAQDLQDIFEMIHCDWFIDKTPPTSGWELVFHEIGVPANEYGRKKLKTIAGGTITGTNSPVGQHVDI